MHDTDTLLHLGWTSDERDYLAIDIRGLLRELLAGEAQMLSNLLCYPVADPFYEDSLGEAVAAFFAKPSLASRVSCAAGVNSILHCLASLPESRVAGVAAPVYPDFPHWLELAGRQPISLTGADFDTYAGFLDDTAHSVLFLERPSFSGGGVGQSIDELRALCMIAARRSNTVLVDESNANYLAPQASGAVLVDEVPNLVVVRGFSKGYGLGGIRLGYCVASAPVAPRLRRVMPPLQASTLSVEIGRRLLLDGDMGAPLRARIEQNKLRMADLLRFVGIERTMPVDRALPYLALADGDAGIARLKRVGIVGKRHAMWAEQGAVSWVYRLSVPLSPARFHDFNRRCRALAVESPGSASAASTLR
ncbi:aminotransferase class I/II-fold pyridoxal phosphate-dependent enzyme [Paraburkholderia phenoliruptrix]|uniref:Aminotransferase n=1 Tax=Paraburkholderia phenoliruptrix TaxID=252970 RepID=A0ABV3WHM8_9BURK|nr:aminotransferase class I/II-fold pyridoxal phosphate-dependent enzyme [Paraburkholderia phenoliruptrix]MDR6392493.1 histidinol-phosphate/aromatic aminotransferase/cobyric acid decarboxylase-like protein [Paraburkholderia phenoliruptrix]